MATEMRPITKIFFTFIASYQRYTGFMEFGKVFLNGGVRGETVFLHFLAQRCLAEETLTRLDHGSLDNGFLPPSWSAAGWVMSRRLRRTRQRGRRLACCGVQWRRLARQRRRRGGGRHGHHAWLRLRKYVRVVCAQQRRCRGDDSPMRISRQSQRVTLLCSVDWHPETNNVGKVTMNHTHSVIKNTRCNHPAVHGRRYRVTRPAVHR